jgi:hypothetical protein
MNSSSTGCPNCRADAYANPHDLLNEATEWLQYARGLTQLLAELVHESDTVDCPRMALGIEAIGALIRKGLQCTADAHARMSWERATSRENGKQGE